MDAFHGQHLSAHWFKPSQSHSLVGGYHFNAMVTAALSFEKKISSQFFYLQLLRLCLFLLPGSPILAISLQAYSFKDTNLSYNIFVERKPKIWILPSCPLGPQAALVTAQGNGCSSSGLDPTGHRRMGSSELGAGPRLRYCCVTAMVVLRVEGACCWR